MPDLDARLERIERAVQALAGATGELVRENRALVQGVTSDRAVLRETLRELNGFVATAGLALERLEGQVGRLAQLVGIGFERLGEELGRLAQVTESGFTRLQHALEENNRLIGDNNRLILENNRLILDNNRLIAENNEAIRRMIDILMRGRGNGDVSPA